MARKRIFDVIQGRAAENAISQRLNDLAAFHERSHFDSIHGTAIVFGNDGVLRHIYEPTSQVTGVRRLERRVGETLTRSVRRDEVLQNGEAFPEIGSDRCLNDFAGRFRHQSAHARKLTNLLRATAGAGIRHHENRIEARHRDLPTRIIGHFFRTQVAQHLIGDAIRHLSPDVDHFVVTFPVGDQAILVLLLNLANVIMGFLEQLLLARRNHHIFDGNGNSRLRGMPIAHIF